MINLLLFIVFPLMALLISTLLINLITRHITNTIYTHNLSVEHNILDLDNNQELLDIE